MHIPAHKLVSIAVVLALAGPTVGAWGETAAHGRTAAVPQRGGPAIPQRDNIAPLNLSDAQRAKIQQCLRSGDTEVSFALKSAKSATSFNPTVGAKIPKGLKPHPFPKPLSDEIPALKPYTYLKFKNELLIVNPVSHNVAAMFPET